MLFVIFVYCFMFIIICCLYLLFIIFLFYLDPRLEAPHQVLKVVDRPLAPHLTHFPANFPPVATFPATFPPAVVFPAAERFQAELEREQKVNEVLGVHFYLFFFWLSFL